MTVRRAGGPAGWRKAEPGVDIGQLELVDLHLGRAPRAVLHEHAIGDARPRGMESVENLDIERFRTAMKPVYDKYADKVGGWKMIQAVLDTK